MRRLRRRVRPETRLALLVIIFVLSAVYFLFSEAARLGPARLIALATSMAVFAICGAGWAVMSESLECAGAVPCR